MPLPLKNGTGPKGPLFQRGEIQNEHHQAKIRH